ncbi:uncharacterized protein AMSG_00543 [Thecamonas trahens ATCC 50062]|uniref:EF-hand domain-containing protein n=1 Tax=Thecamonas trahens ATCC 50062 TaxID=461836 RepID=A0A0L0D9M0_THETB|nr:hypothetical protein AMSG_00543 [Thecamonas trahens ATCC 50062]KNC48766.1 hypothetical protein AMSG_00543 [Thecamonas trahens ATCC 50062]|eukprot:XP_013762817.1 hypothetical protein AMSG_00543 [Thecamonas trahens ATCC 50062]
MYLFSCSFNFTSCYAVQIEPFAQAAKRPAVVADPANNRVFVASPAQYNSNHLHVHRCINGGQSCDLTVDVSTLASQGINSGLAPSIAYDSVTSTVYIAVQNNFAVTNRAFVFKCNDDLSACSIHNASGGAVDESGIEPSIAIDEVGRLVYVATTDTRSAESKARVVVCDMNISSCTGYDISPTNNAVSNVNIALNAADLVFYVSYINEGASGFLWLSRCSTVDFSCTDELVEANSGTAYANVDVDTTVSPPKVYTSFADSFTTPVVAISACPVTWDRPTNLAGASLASPDIVCSSLFSNAAILGSSAACTWATPSKLTVVLGASPTAVPGNMLLFAAPVLDAATRAATGVVLQAAPNSAQPVANLIAPPTVDSCGTIAIDATTSSGIRTQTTFRLVSPVDLVVSAALDAAFPASRISIDVGGWPTATPYVFEVNVTDWLGVSSSAQTTVVKDPGTPLIALSAKSLAITSRTPLAVDVSVAFAACPSDATTPVAISWSTLSGPVDPFATGVADPARNVLLLPPGSLPPGSTHVFKVNVSTTALAVAKSSVDTVSVSVRFSQLVAHIKGGAARTILSNANLDLDGSASYDPDAVAGGLTYTWSCSAGGSACVSAPSSVDWSSPLLSIPVALLTAPLGSDMTITLRVAQGARSATTTAVVTRANLPFVSTRAVWRDDDLVPNVNEVIIFLSEVLPELADDTLEFLWDESASRIDLHPDNDTLATTTATMRNFGIRANRMRTEIDYDFRLYVRVIRESGTFARASPGTRITSRSVDAAWRAAYPHATFRGSATVVGTRAISPYFFIASQRVLLNAVPAGGTFTTNVSSDATAATLVTFTFAGWTDADDDTVLYAIQQELPSGDRVDLVPSSIGTSHSVYLQAGLAADDFRVSVIGIVSDDRFGAAPPVRLTLRVRPFPVASGSPGAAAASLIDGILADAIALGNTHQARQLISSISAVLNGPPPTPGATVDPVAQTSRLRLFNVLSSVSRVTNSTVGELAQTASLLSLVLGTPAEVSPALTIRATAMVQQLVAGLVGKRVSEAQASSVSTALAAIIRADGAAGSSSDGSATATAFALLSDVTDALMADAVDGMAPLVASNSMFRLEVQQFAVANIAASKPTRDPQAAVTVVEACSACLAFSSNPYAFNGGRRVGDPNGTVAFDALSAAVISLDYATTPASALSLGAALPAVQGKLAVDRAPDPIRIVIPLSGAELGADACVFWSDALGGWNTTGCQVGTVVRGSHAECVCNHLTTFAVNTLDASDFARLGSVEDQPEALIVVVILWAAFLIALPFLYMYDIRDRELLLVDRTGKLSAFLRAKRAKIRGKKHLLWHTLKESMVHKHLWLSLALKLEDDPFTRVFRAAVLLTTLTAGMAVAAAFYRDQDDDSVSGTRGRITELVVSVIIGPVLFGPLTLAAILMRKSSAGTVYGLLPRERHWLWMNPSASPADAIGRGGDHHSFDNVSLMPDRFTESLSLSESRASSSSSVSEQEEGSFSSSSASTSTSASSSSSSLSARDVHDALADALLMTTEAVRKNRYDFSSSIGSDRGIPVASGVARKRLAGSSFSSESDDGATKLAQRKGPRRCGCLCRKAYKPTVDEMIAALPRNVLNLAASDFARMDLDGNGSLDRSEVAVIMSHRGWIVEPKELENIFKVIDTDASGAIEFEEFLSVVALRHYKLAAEEEAMRHGKLAGWFGWLVFVILVVVSAGCSLLVIVYGLKFSRPVVHSWLRTFFYTLVADILFFEPLKVIGGVLMASVAFLSDTNLAELTNLF